MNNNFLKVFAILNKKIQSLTLNTESQQIDIDALQLDVGALQDDVTELKQKSILSAGINNAISITTAGDNTIAIDKEITKIGNKITIDNGKIKINDDIGKILISAKVQMTLKNNSGNTKNIYIHKNGTSVIDILNEVYRTADNWRFSASASEIPISVAKNDVIELKGYFGVGDIIQSQDSRTYITVKEV